MDKLIEEGIVEKYGSSYTISPAYYCKAAFLSDIERNYESRKRVIELMRLVDIMSGKKNIELDEVWEICKKDKLFSSLSKDTLRNHLIALTGRGVLTHNYNPIETFSFHYANTHLQLLHSINDILSQQEEEATATEKLIRDEIHKFNDEYRELANAYIDKKAVFEKKEAEIIKNEDSSYVNSEYDEIALIKEKIEKQKNKISNLSGLKKVLMENIESKKLRDLENNLTEHEHKAEMIDDAHNRAIDKQIKTARLELNDIEGKLSDYANQRKAIQEKIASVERVFGWCRNPDLYPPVTVTPYVPISQRKERNTKKQENNEVKDKTISTNQQYAPYQKPDDIDFTAMYAHGAALTNIPIDNSGNR